MNLPTKILPSDNLLSSDSSIFTFILLFFTDRNIPSVIHPPLSQLLCLRGSPILPVTGLVHVSCCEDFVYGGLILLWFCIYIGSSINGYLECVCYIFLTANESGCDKNYVSGMTSSVPSTGTIIIRPVFGSFRSLIS